MNGTKKKLAERRRALRWRLEKVEHHKAERKKAKQRIVAERKKLEDIMENMIDGVTITDTQGIITYINRATTLQLGYTREECIGKTPGELFIDEQDVPKFIEYLKAAALGKEVTAKEYLSKRKDGTRFPVSVNLSLRKDSEDNPYQIIAVHRDITERKRAEKKLLDYQAQLKTLASELFLAEERERRRLSAGIHDHTCQDLVMAKLTLQSLKESVLSYDMSASLDKVCATIEQTIQDLRTLTFELSNPVLYELGFEAAVKQWLTEQVQEKYGVKCKLTTNKHPLKLDNEISVILFQAVRELLVNVIKHAKANTVGVHIQKDSDRIRITVEDNGVGFPQSKLDSSPLQSKTGGFGLFSIRERLDNLGGELKIKSAPGQGTRITMSAPLKR